MKIDGFEYWQNLSIKTTTNIPNNKSDLIIWDKSNQASNVVEFSCPVDSNIAFKVQYK